LNAFSAMFVRLFRHIARYAPRQTGKYASKIQFKPTVDKIKTASEKKTNTFRQFFRSENIGTA